MRVQRQKTARILSLNPTVDNPWDKIKFNFWKDRITNICLGAAQAAFQSHEDNTNLKFLFSASDKSNTVVHRADQRNVQGLILFHPILLQAPWEASSSLDADIAKLLQEKVPLIVDRAYVQKSLVSSAPTTVMPKGNYKGKGRGAPKGKSDEQSLDQSSNGKGKICGRGKGSFVP
jgi:hypothetical protein